MKYNECNCCAEHDCADCLIHRIDSIPEEKVLIQHDVNYMSEIDYSTALIQR